MRAWSEGLQKKELAKLNNKIDALSIHGTELIPGIVSPSGMASIFKLKVHGQVQLRPMLCEGPTTEEPAFTFLIGAKEIHGEYDPPNAPAIASELRQKLIKNPSWRRIHERVNR